MRTPRLLKIVRIKDREPDGWEWSGVLLSL